MVGVPLFFLRWLFSFSPGAKDGWVEAGVLLLSLTLVLFSAPCAEEGRVEAGVLLLSLTACLFSAQGAEEGRVEAGVPLFVRGLKRFEQHAAHVGARARGPRRVAHWQTHRQVRPGPGVAQFQDAPPPAWVCDGQGGVCHQHLTCDRAK